MRSTMTTNVIPNGTLVRVDMPAILSALEAEDYGYLFIVDGYSPTYGWYVCKSLATGMTCAFFPQEITTEEQTDGKD